MENITKTVLKTKSVHEKKTLSKSTVYSIALFVAALSYIVTYVAIQTSAVLGVVGAVVAIPVVGYLVYRATSNNKE